MSLRSIFLPLLTLILFSSCSKVPISNRKQMHLLNEHDLIQMANLQYEEFMTNAEVLPSNHVQSKKIQKIGEKVQHAAESFLKKNGHSHRVDGFAWEFKTVESEVLNAWCMPGGKVCFYTGLIELADNDDQIAAVMGHEIAHAIAKHGNERMSQQLALTGIMKLSGVGQKDSTETKTAFDYVFSGSASLGMLKFSRVHETESDKLGLVFMKLAGYNPNESISFWNKMAEQGGFVPQILSTHPSDETRINDLQEFIDTELDNYVD
ncbi:MAG: M48 family metallopeptidase [Flavobacteriales bacterium]|nr:M48 family metallopeptidase [Flavobacteriales bacterium]